tara:strand:- start:369 stop:551 length:183 start_codon:yes stop_codon:yes gene_type:complete
MEVLLVEVQEVLNQEVVQLNHHTPLIQVQVLVMMVEMVQVKDQVVVEELEVLVQMLLTVQ